jgi:hypothetical protein
MQHVGPDVMLVSAGQLLDSGYEAILSPQPRASVLSQIDPRTPTSGSRCVAPSSQLCSGMRSN